MRTHYVQLDGMRGLAILLLMIYHFCLPHPTFHTRDAAVVMQSAQAGWAGVDLFFVLSGFLITSILVETRSGENYFRNFLARRFLRIWPLYCASLLVFFVLLPLVANNLPREVEVMRD